MSTGIYNVSIIYKIFLLITSGSCVNNFCRPTVGNPNYSKTGGVIRMCGRDTQNGVLEINRTFPRRRQGGKTQYGISIDKTVSRTRCGRGVDFRDGEE